MVYTVVILLFLMTVGLGVFIRAGVKAMNKPNDHTLVRLDEILDGPSEL